MSLQVIWLFVSYAFLIGIGVSLGNAGHQWGYWLALVIPLIRLARRFSERGGYRLFGIPGNTAGNVGERGGFASRTENRLFFFACTSVEIGVIVLFWILMLLRDR
ncbi:MAG: hypothetical protein AAGL69_15110 [Pseudomonadota bacterium]